MVSELIDRLLKSRHEYYMVGVALLLLGGSAYVYLNFYKDKTADVITGGISSGAAALGYFLLLYGFYEATTNYQMQKELYEVQYEIKPIELNAKLKSLKKKYKIKEKLPRHKIIWSNLKRIYRLYKWK